MSSIEFCRSSRPLVRSSGAQGWSSRPWSSSDSSNGWTRRSSLTRPQVALLARAPGSWDVGEGLEHRGRQRAVLVEDVRALLRLVANGLPVGLVVSVAAGVDLQAHAAGLAHIEIVLLAHAVLAGTELDRDILVEEDVRDPQKLLTRVDEVGKVGGSLLGGETSTVG